MKRFSTYRAKCQFQIMMLGDAAVGKSSLVLRYVSDRAPTLSEPIATVGVEYWMRTVFLPGGVVRLKIWDTSGQERHRELLRSYYDLCNGAFIVYDIQNRESFQEAQHWVTELRERVSPDLVIVIAGNKADMDKERKVPKHEAEEYAAQNNLIFMETSSVSCLNVNNCFTEIAQTLFDQRKKLKLERKKSNGKKDENEENKTCFCCFHKRQKSAPKLPTKDRLN